MIERDYKITPTTMSFGNMYKVEMWNDHGMKRTVYEENIDTASEVIVDWWEASDEEYGKMKSLQVVLNNKVKKEIR
tara:strand:- start:872 stop:1099 length:228 start_codon:yes stop_codon:yes gene_type:complete